MWDTFHQPTDLGDALDLLTMLGPRGVPVAGGTGVLIDARRGALPPRAELVDLGRLPDLGGIRADGDALLIGALVTHDDVASAPLVRERAAPLAEACAGVGSPLVRSRATLVGSLVARYPVRDPTTPLVALGARAIVASSGGQRVLPVADLAAAARPPLRPGALIVGVRVPMLGASWRGRFLRLGLRAAATTSVANLAVLLAFDGELVVDARVAVGGPGPLAVRVPAAEASLVGGPLSRERADVVADHMAAAVPAGDDLRGTERYRRRVLAALATRALADLAKGHAAAPAAPPRLGRPTARPAALAPYDGSVDTVVNGQARTLAGAGTRTLLDALREDLGLTGTKNGCAHGRCGACTVLLGGRAVLSCLVPAAQAHGVPVVTVEGLAGSSPGAADDGLHPLQRAFVEHGAVQCGYCTPGLLMAAAGLLATDPSPDRTTVRQALAGNICRCTGYRKVVDAVVAAGQAGGAGPGGPVSHGHDVLPAGDSRR